MPYTKYIETQISFQNKILIYVYIELFEYANHDA